MESTNVLIKKKDNVGILTINHPPANAVNLATLDDFNKALDDLEKDNDVRVVILTGVGEKGFSAGFDVSDAANGERCRTYGSATWTRVDRFSKPVIAAINGFALGGGCELALASHFRIMVDSPKATIGLTELNLGIIPGWGGCVRMARALGRTKALDLILFSKKLTAPEALVLGLIDKVCAPGDVMKEAMDLALNIAKRPPIAVSCVINAINGFMNKGIDEGLRLEQEGVQKVVASKDAAEGFAAFFEKRPPAFKGE